MSDDPMEKYDEVVQMQLSEFQRHILGATNAELCIVITETNGVAQCASGSNKMPEAKGKGKAAALIAQVAAALVADGSDGQFEVLLRDKRTGELMPAGSNVPAMVVKV